MIKRQCEKNYCHTTDTMCEISKTKIVDPNPNHVKYDHKNWCYVMILHIISN